VNFNKQTGIDTQLEERLRRWHDQVERVNKAEREFLLLDAQEKSFLAQLFLNSDEGPIAQKEAQAQNHPDWKHFKTTLAIAKSEFNNERRKLDLTIKAYEACYLTYKLENDVAKRGS